MNKRIRYIKSAKENVMMGNKYFKSNSGKEYQVSYEPGSSGFMGTVVDVSGEQHNIVVTATSPHKIKIALKKALTDLGCVFESETRGGSEAG